jgi:hypothetical protein
MGRVSVTAPFRTERKQGVSPLMRQVHTPSRKCAHIGAGFVPRGTTIAVVISRATLLPVPGLSLPAASSGFRCSRIQTGRSTWRVEAAFHVEQKWPAKFGARGDDQRRLSRREGVDRKTLLRRPLSGSIMDVRPIRVPSRSCVEIDRLEEEAIRSCCALPIPDRPAGYASYSSRKE